MKPHVEMSWDLLLFKSYCISIYEGRASRDISGYGAKMESLGTHLIVVVAP